MRVGLFLLFLASACSNTEPHPVSMLNAGSDALGSSNRASCLVRPLLAESFETWSLDAETRALAVPDLVRMAKQVGLWDSTLREHYNRLRPRDVYCMLSGTRQPEEIVAQFPAYGGSILLGTEARPETLPALESPDIHDNRTVFETVVARLDSAEKVRRQNACFALDNAGEQERCFDDLVGRQDYPSDRFRPLLGAIPLRPPGEVHAFDYGERPGAGFASFLSGTRAFETARMPLYDPDPDAVEVFALGRRLPGFAANAKSVTQWQALSTEIIARDLALEISSRVLLELASTDNIIVEELELVTDVRRPTAYPGLGLQMTSTERAVSEFVCADTYRQAFNSPAGQSYWQSLLRLEVALCSPEHLGIPVWYAPAALEKSPLSVRQSLEFFQREDIANRLESAIVELAAIEVDLFPVSDHEADRP